MINQKEYSTPPPENLNYAYLIQNCNTLLKNYRRLVGNYEQLLMNYHYLISTHKRFMHNCLCRIPNCPSHAIESYEVTKEKIT